MALELKLEIPIEATNDGQYIVVSDDTGDGNTGWGAGSNPDFPDIDGSTYFLELEITYTDPDGTEVTYDPIDLYTDILNSSAPVNLTDIEFIVHPGLLDIASAPIGSEGDAVNEGFYKFLYTLWDSDNPVTRTDVNIMDQYETNALIAPVTKNRIYNNFRNLNKKYLTRHLTDNIAFDLDDAEIVNLVAQYNGLEADQNPSNKDMSLEILKDLQSKTLNL